MAKTDVTAINAKTISVNGMPIPGSGSPNGNVTTWDQLDADAVLALNGSIIQGSLQPGMVFSNYENINVLSGVSVGDLVRYGMASSPATSGATGPLNAFLGSGAVFRQQLLDRSALTQATTNLANGSAFTQIGDQMQLTAIRDDTEIVVTEGNFYANSAAATDLKGLSAVTFRRSIYDGTTYYPLTSSGSRDLVVQPGQIASWDPLPLNIKKGQGLLLIGLKTWASAPASFPGSPIPFNGARDLSEAGSTLTDRTLTGGFTAAARVSGTAILPPVSIRGASLSSRRAVIAALTDSIASAGASDADTNRGQRGYLQRGCFAAGIPLVVLGQTGLKASDVLSNATVTGQYLAPAVMAGATHIYLGLGVNDLPKVANLIYSDLQAIATAARSAIPGVKVILTTISPKTNAANTAPAGGDANLFGQRQALNSLIRTNNGVGDGYFDLASLVQDQVNTDFWRTDLLTASAVTLANGGANNLPGDLVETDIGLVVQTGGTAGQPATAINIRAGQGGGFLTAPTTPALEETRQNAGATYPAAVGSGLQVNVTATAAVAIPTDGLHPSPGMHSFAKRRFTSDAKTLFAVS